MSRVLFRHKAVSNEEVIKKMKYFIWESEYAMEHHRADDSTMIKLARELRKELQTEYNNNNLKNIRKHYADHELFECHYKPAVHEALASVTGILNTEKAYNFLHYVKNYMEKYIPEDAH